METKEPKRLAIGVVGLGRIGRQHALNALHSVPRTQLLSACSPAPADLEWAQEHLVPYGVKIYSNFEEMLEHQGLEALLIASTTVVHHEQVIAGMKKDLHVLVGTFGDDFCGLPGNMANVDNQRNLWP
jgi:myo-inositol 2-dehydrogenase/D-chiro-inositol 1-dehydrogenase